MQWKNKLYQKNCNKPILFGSNFSLTGNKQVNLKNINCNKIMRL